MFYMLGIHVNQSTKSCINLEFRLKLNACCWMLKKLGLQVNMLAFKFACHVLYVYLLSEIMIGNSNPYVYSCFLFDLAKRKFYLNVWCLSFCSVWKHCTWRLIVCMQRRRRRDKSESHRIESIHWFHQMWQAPDWELHYWTKPM